MKFKKLAQKKMNHWVEISVKNESMTKKGICPWPHLIYEPKKPSQQDRKK